MTHLSLLVDVTFGEAITHHLGMKMVQDPLDLSDTALSSRVDLVESIVCDQVQELGVQVVETLV